MSTRYNFVSETSDGMGFAARLVDEGEDVRLWIRNPDAKTVGDNIVPKVGDLEDLIHEADLLRDVYIFDTSGNGVIADYVAEQGFATFGGSLLADRLERDRSFGAKVMEDCGIEVPKTASFTDFDTAKQFVEDNPDERWVYKPSKQLGDLSPSHVSYDSEDLIQMLDNISKDVDIADVQFELQAFEPGVAISTELWFQHGSFLPCLTNHTLERKELMDGDIGPSGGCLGNIVWGCDGCLLCDAAKGLVKWANRVNYHGMLDLNVIVSEKNGQIFGLEFTPRFGYDASPTLVWELIPETLGRFFADAARGQHGTFELRDGFAGAVRITLPPWPTEKYHAEENVPLRGIEDNVLKYSTYLYNVKRNADDLLCSAGAWGIICLFTGHSSDPARSLARPTEYCKELKLKNKQYRTDLGKQFKEDLAKLEVEIGVH